MNIIYLTLWTNYNFIFLISGLTLVYLNLDIKLFSFLFLLWQKYDCFRDDFLELELVSITMLTEYLNSYYFLIIHSC